MQRENHFTSGRSCIVAREGWVFILLFGLIAGVFFFLGVPWLGVPMVLLTIFTVYFFRNPERIGPKGDACWVPSIAPRTPGISELEDNAYTNFLFIRPVNYSS